jgi:hypothetical protein
MKVTPTNASIIAKMSSGDPIITKNSFGQGEVYVTTPDYLQDAASTKILNIGQKLLDTLQARFSPVQVQGPQLEYLVNTGNGKTIATLVNTSLSGAAWTGSLTFNAASGIVKEWTTDTVVPSTVRNGKVVANVSVPPYDVKVFALE